MNIDRIGPGLRLGPAYNQRDGRLDLVLVSATERPRLLRHLHDSVADANFSKGLPRRRCQQVTLTLGPGDLLIDDQVTTLRTPARLEIGIARGALTLVLPRDT